MNHFYLRITPADTVRIVISVSKKVSKKAVVRNQIKRRIRAVVRDLTHSLKPNQYFIVAKPNAENVKGEELKKELESLVVSCRL